MPSELRSETARLNGAKSRGPKTPETVKNLRVIPLSTASPRSARLCSIAKALRNSRNSSINIPPCTSLPTPPIAAPLTPKDDAVDDEELLAKEEVKRLSLSNEKLLELAKKYPPPPEYFDGDEEMPFDPIKE